MFGVLFIAFSYFNWGNVAHSWDEMSHWMTAVKSMSYIDDFLTNPDSKAYFKSCPPAMALLQYFFQKVYFMVSGGNIFNEWRMYLVYQMFTLSMIFPFFKFDNKRKLLVNITYLSALIILPSLLL